ncbi:hypothetical protein DPX39_110126000 [Trypanosoma brucei equiperdum]|uniref:Uncharacterized protein n=1 Tax=Trypanosoma brucei equiperdum TaxID=630700 RepID=A0A3L6KVX2_9TRYP|nr:hypothetical protein DPX39_110126000 [Trypanosoma brucei equiperdum]
MIETPDASSGVYPQIHQIREMIREVSGVLESDLQVVREGWDKLRKARETIMKGFLGTNIDSPSVHSPRDRGTILPEDVELSTMEDGESMNDMCISEDSASDNSHGEVENVGRDDAAPFRSYQRRHLWVTVAGGRMLLLWEKLVSNKRTRVTFQRKPISMLESAAESFKLFMPQFRACT